MDHLAGRSALVVLDNCEHVRDGCAAAVTELLVRCPKVRVIATSREALGIPGEQSFPVTGLAYPDPESMDAREIERCEAVRLFVARAERTRPDFSFTGRNAVAGAEICRRLEGVPLAIELAASRVRAMPVTKIAENLLEVLDPTRVLESSIAWSVELLSDLERTMLGRLSVFRGGWALEAAEAVCADPRGRTIARDEVLGLLTQLVDKSLVLYEEREDRARYHLLETVREYARKHLIKSRSLAPLHRRHLDFFLDLAEEASAGFEGENQVAWLERLEGEHENLRGALEFSGDGADVSIAMRMCIALNPFWCVHGHLIESRAHLERVLDDGAEADAVLRIRAENQAGIVAERQGDLPGGRAHYERALAIAREIGDERRAAGILTNLGLLAQDEGDIADSRRRHEAGMALYESLGEAYGVAMVQLNLAVVAKLEGNTDEARRLLNACIVVFREHGDTQRIAAALHNLGEVTLRDGPPGRARTYLEESLSMRREMRDKLATAQTMLWLAVAATAEGRAEQAATLLAMAESIRQDAHAPLAPTDAAEYDRCLDDVRTRLDPAAFDTAWGAGSTMAFDQATGYAMDSR